MMYMKEEKKLNIYPINNIQHFIDNYPDETLRQHFSLLKQTFPYHRAVKGDGNCFYRVFSFLYLSNNQFQSFQQTFPMIQMKCYKKSSFIKSNYHFQSQLKFIWDQHLKQLSKVTNTKEKQQKLQSLFNQVQIFDELMIGYFRSVNYQYIKNNKINLMPFLEQNHNIIRELERVSTFGAQSEGIQIYSLADAMKTKITIFCIDYRGFQPIQYKQNLQDKGFYLFFRPGHYDIVYSEYQKGFKFTTTRKEKASNPQQKTGLFREFFDKNNLQGSNPQAKNNIQKQHAKSAPKTQKPQNLKRVVLGDFQNGPMSKVWVQVLGTGVLSLFVYVLYNRII